MSGLFEMLLLMIGLAALGLLVWVGLVISRGSRERMMEAAAQFERQRHLDQQMSDVRALQAEVTGRIATLTQSVGERFDSLQNRVGDGLKENVKETTENLSKLNERLAVI